MVEFPMLEEISEQHKGTWTLAWTECLRRWSEADTDHDKDTALLWMGFLSQCLQRKPTRGGKKGRVEVASRYKCVQEGDWAGLVEKFERDKVKRAAQLEKMREDRENEDREKKRSKRDWKTEERGIGCHREWTAW